MMMRTKEEPSNWFCPVIAVHQGNCYDNACCESFFHTLKTEEVYFNRYRTRAEARASIFEYIEGWYNIKRRHSTLGYKAPSQFELLKRAS